MITVINQTYRRIRILMVVLLAAAPLMTACGSAPSGGGGIVVTTNILGDVVTNIIDGETEVTVLMQPNANPHSFGVSAKEAAILEQADLVVYNGLGLEEGVLHHVEAAADAGVPTLEVARHVDPMKYTEGETSGSTDPHFWTDPLRMRDAVDLIADHIVSHVDDIDVSDVASNAEAYRTDIDRLHDQVEDMFAAIPTDRRKLITNHHVFGYFADRYDFTVVGAVIPSGTTLASPSASDLKDLADAVEESGVEAVFADSSQPDQLVRAMADEVGIHIEVIPLHSESLSLPGEGADTYLAMVESNALEITRGLTE